MTVSSRVSETSLSDIEKLPVTPQPEQQQNAITSQENNSEQPVEPEKAAFNPSKSFILAFASICVVTLASAVDATSLSIALPIVTLALKGGAIDAFWSGTSFLVTSAVIMPVAGGLSHVFGRKQVCIPFSYGRRNVFELTLA
jgi:hypothetical protein